MTKATNPARLAVPAAGDRALDVLVDGPPGGLVLVLHPGTPSGLVAFAPMTAAASARGLRTVLYSRPGYGGSTPQPGRRVADAAADVAAILDQLGAAQFITAGWSGGGPHALACVAGLPGRCLAAATIGGIAPRNSPGLDWLAGMGPENIEEFGAAAAGQAALTRFLEAAAAQLAEITGPVVAEGLGGLMSPVDAAAVTDEYADYLAAALRAAVRGGIAGWRDDDLAFVAGWGFDLGALDGQVPIAIWQGDQDRMVPAGHGAWLAAHVAGARPRLLSGHGHLTLVKTAFGQILDDLAGLSGWSGAAAGGRISLPMPGEIRGGAPPAGPPEPGFDPAVVRAAYDAMAADYADRFGADLEQLPLDTEILDLLARRAGPRGPVLDVGCGPAQVGGYLAARGAQVAGIDLAPAMLETARRQPGLGAVAADLRWLPVASGSCAAVVSFYALHHVPRAELPGVLREFRRVLAADGELALAAHEGEGDFTSHSDPMILGTLYTAAELERALAQAGLRVDTVRRRDPLPHERQSGRVYLTAVTRPS
jgi:pimeloyl-ACP methyl ester carboxylesterase/2-polyprenyl-3-methyl-5-hydroxy-6-metoxy-1,4-benzoquinol methylase